MTSRTHLRISPYKQLHAQVSTDTVCFSGTVQDISHSGSCISLSTEKDLPIHRDNRLLIRCQLKDLIEKWGDETFVGRVRWIKEQNGQTIFGVEFMDTDEFYHPIVFSLRTPEPV